MLQSVSMPHCYRLLEVGFRITGRHGYADVVLPY
jgi:hypothetical protein